jgi:hypothetical protein
MTRKRKIFIILCLFFVLALLALSGIGFYYYSNPSKLKPLAESALSRFTGTECSIKEISYSHHPLVIRAKGIQFIEHIQGFYLEIPEIVANISLEGSFGRRSLVFNDLRVTALSLSMNQGWPTPEITREAERPSFFRRILGGLFSFFLVKDVKVREARLEDGHVTGQWEDLKINLNGMQAQLSPEQFFEMGCGVRVQSLSDQIDLKIPSLKVITDKPVFPLNALIPARVKGEEITIETPQGNVTNALMEASVLYSPEGETVDFKSLKISFNGMTLNEGVGSRFVPLRSLVEATVSLDLHEQTLVAPSVHFVLGSIAELKGELHAHLQEGKEFGVKVTDLKAVPQNLVPLLPNPLKGKLEPLTFTGSILASGRLGGSIGQDPGQWACDLQARLRENNIIFANPGFRFETRVTAEMQVRGSLSSLETSLSANCDDSALQAGNAQFDRGTIRVSLTGTYPSFDVKALNIHMPSARWKTGGRELFLEQIEGQATSGRFDVNAKTLQLPELSLHTSTLKNLSVSTEFAKGELSVGAKGKDVHLLELLQAMEFIPPGWKIQSTDSFHAQAVLGGDGRLTLTSKMEIQGLSFESPDGRCLGENLSLVVEPTVEGALIKNAALNGSVFLYVREGEVLYDRFYLDLSQHPLISDGKGRFQPDLLSTNLSDFRLQLENLAILTAQGTFSWNTSRESRLSVHLSKTPLEPLFRQFVLEPYKHQSPFLDDLQINGFFSADLEMSKQDTRWTVKGHAFWQEGAALLEGDEILLEGIDMDLPLWYQEGAKSTEEKKPVRKTPVEIKGSLSIQSVQLPLLPAQPIDIPLRASPDRMSTTSPLSLRVAGGQIDLGRILLRDPFSGSPDLDTSITIKKIDLGPWLARIWSKPLQGSVRGKLDPVRWEGGTLRTKGELVANLFGGQMTLSNVGGTRSLSLAPAIQLDAIWEDLNLAEMTRDTAFGKIEGSLRGSIKGLEIADEQPQRFDLFMETVKKKDVPQKISVRAVDNIAQIGGGASPFSGVTGAFVSLFKELPYEKIGIKASLENDVFRINGTIKEHGREYLVKKGGFSGVDVIIGSSGGNTISFKDMVKRIKRVTASQGHPAVE